MLRTQVSRLTYPEQTVDSGEVEPLELVDIHHIAVH